MGRNRTVTPGSDRIYLSDGDWIEVKRELNVGDTRKIEAAGVKPVILNGRVYYVTDMETHDLVRALIIITGWNLCGPEDRVLDLNIDTIRALDNETFNEINSAILKHIIEVQGKKLKARLEAEAAKKSQTPDTTPPNSMTSEPVVYEPTST